ncbi:hypothetical protein, partial [Marinitenerispora sediminis]
TPTARPSAAPFTWLRRFLALDAVVTGGNGVGYLAASAPLGRLLGVDSALLLGVGVFLVLYGAAVGLLAARPRPGSGAVAAVIGANALWVLVSLAAVPVLAPGVAGMVWIPLQAAVVAGFAALQYGALRSVRR